MSEQKDNRKPPAPPTSSVNPREKTPKSWPHEFHHRRHNNGLSITWHVMKETSSCIITTLNTWLSSPGQPITRNGQSGFRVQTAVRRRTPDLFLPFYPAWQSFSYQSVIPDELPGTRPAQDWGGTWGGVQALMWVGGFCWAPWHGGFGNSSSASSNCDG